LEAVSGTHKRIYNNKVLSKIHHLLKRLTKNPKKLIFLLLVTLLAFTGFRKLTKFDFESEVYVVKPQLLKESITASGSVSAEKLAELTFLASENISEILVEDGQEVKKGDIIARLNTVSLYQSYLQAEADLRDKQATLDRVYDDLKGKDETETFPEKETRISAETNKDKAYRAFVIAEKNLGNATLRAPFDGVVNYTEKTSVGKLSSAASPTFIIVDPKTIYFEAEVNELDITKLKKGTNTEIILDAFPDKTFSQEVKSINFISSTTSTGGTAYKVKISLPENPGNIIRIGMNGDAEFITAERDGVLTIPQSALFEDEENIVWVIEKGRAVSKIVETGISSIDHIEVIGGLSEGETVILNPPFDIKKGSRVKILH